MILTGLAATAGLASAAQEAPTPAAAAAPDIGALIRQLADDNFHTREQATRKIWDLGEAALPALREAVASADPEQVYRARELLRKIQLNITPDTDPAVTALVERFVKASTTEKNTLFDKLKAKGAWRQMLKLYAGETRAEVREKLQSTIQGVAVKAARERLLAGDAREAREFLEMAPADAGNLLALAEFHRSHGTLEAELEKTRSVKGQKSDAWQAALLRAAGDFAAARDAAHAAGDERIAALMAALAGDPLPWLKFYPEYSNELQKLNGAEPNAVTTAYAAAAAKRWRGQSLRPADLEPLTHQLSARNALQRLAAMNAMFLLGENAPAEAALTKLAPLAAFRQFDALERAPEALKALGLDPQQPDYKSWVEQRLKKLPADDIEDQREPSEQLSQVVALANFLERRGLHEEAATAFYAPLTALADQNANRFLDLLAKFFGTRESLSSAPRLARRIAVTWAGNDDKRWDDIVAAAFGEDELARAWWDQLATLDPAASRPDRYDAMLALFGLGPDPAKLRDKWLGMAWQAVAAAPAGQRDTLVSRISSLTLVIGDVPQYLKAWDLLPETKRAEIFWGAHIQHLAAADRWDEAARIIIAQIDHTKETHREPGPHLYAYAAAALRQAGRPDEAATYDRWADQLALGNTAVAIGIGNAYAFGRDYQRAAEWWARAAGEADPEAGELSIALMLHADILVEQGKWQHAAAVTETLTLIRLAGEYRSANPLLLMHERLQSDMARALATLDTDRTNALALLEKCHHTFASDGSLADFFFPSLRKAGLIKEHDTWFQQTWDLMAQVIATYPNSDNTRNTAAWFAARAARNLDAAEQLQRAALSASPYQSAYLDTMAEIQFAKGHRDKALEWSKLAVNFLPDDPQLPNQQEELCRQQEHFRRDPLPVAPDP